MKNLRDLLLQLRETRSPRRRAAAKALRRLQAPEAGPALLEALHSEVLDERTWETQYQMIMALGECGHRAAVPFLHDLAKQKFAATMVFGAIGDALVRLAATEQARAASILECMYSQNLSLAQGAFRAMAMLETVPDPKVIESVIDFVSKQPPQDGLAFWVVAAAAGWKGAKVEAFLEVSANSPRADVRDAARESIAGRYQERNPL